MEINFVFFRFHFQLSGRTKSVSSKANLTSSTALDLSSISELVF